MKKTILIASLICSVAFANAQTKNTTPTATKVKVVTTAKPATATVKEAAKETKAAVKPTTIVVKSASGAPVQATVNKATDNVDDRMKGPKGEKIMIGANGGRYYINAKGNKTYVPYKGNKKK